MKPEAFAACLLIAACLVNAQSLQLYSEFRRIGPDGAVLASDAHGKPREIISPAVPRNGFTTTRVAVQVPAGTRYAIHIGENPEGSFLYSLYRENGDVLEKVTLPYEADAPSPVRTQTFLFDMFVPQGFRPSRIRVEVQLNAGANWIIQPMEVRVQAATIPAHVKPTSALAPPNLNIVQTAFAAIQSALCAPSPVKGKEAASLTARHLLRRNVAQDMALARTLEPAMGKENLHGTMLGFIGAPDAKTWCGARLNPNAPYDPESYLKLRDYLLRTALR